MKQNDSIPIPVLKDRDIIAVSDFAGQYREILVDFDMGSFAEEWQKNNSWQISFTVTKTDRNSFTYELINEESAIYYKGEKFIVTSLDRQASGGHVTKSVTATHQYFQIQHGRQYKTISGNLTIEQCLNHLFKGNDRGITYSVVGNFEKVEQENFGDINYLDGVKEILEDYDAVLDVTGLHLTFYEPSQFGRKTNEYIRYKYNTDEIQFQADTTTLKTQIMGYGKQKSEEEGGGYYFSPITYTSPLASEWGIRIAEPVRDERFTNASAMLTKLKQTLQDYPNISGTVKLSRKMDVEKGDWLTIIYEPLNTNIEAQIVSYKKFPFLNQPPEITISNTKDDIIKIQAQLAREIKKMKRG